MAKQGRKPLFDLDKFKNGGKIKLSVKQSEFGYQYAYSLRERNKGRNFKYDTETRELYEVIKQKF